MISGFPSPEPAPADRNPLRPGPLPGPLGRAASWIYGKAIDRINARYDRARGVLSLDRPVISIGNLSVGGTGKTPTVRWVLDQLLLAGHRPCVAMRGYAPSATGSDEAQEYRDAFATRDGWRPPVVARADRFGGLLDLFATDLGEKADSVVLDDGFQHRKLARDLDVVLLDATRDPFADALLPAGWLREPPRSLCRAHVAIITHTEMAPAATVAAIASRARAINPRLIIGASRHEWTALDRVATAREPASATDLNLAAARVGLICAIGNPDPFIRQARVVAGSLVFTRILPDHDPYAPPTIADLLEAVVRDRVQVLLTTAKDWTKLRRVRPDRWPCDVVVPHLDIRVVENEAAIRAAILAAAANQPEPIHEAEADDDDQSATADPGAETR